MHWQNGKRKVCASVYAWGRFACHCVCFDVFFFHSFLFYSSVKRQFPAKYIINICKCTHNIYCTNIHIVPCHIPLIKGIAHIVSQAPIQAYIWQTHTHVYCIHIQTIQFRYTPPIFASNGIQWRINVNIKKEKYQQQQHLKSGWCLTSLQKCVWNGEMTLWFVRGILIRIAVNPI